MARKVSTGRTAQLPNVAEALAILQRIANGEADKIPEGFYTSSQWCAFWELSIPHTNKLLKGGITAGNVERRMFRVHCGSRLLPTPHYKVSA